MCACVCTLTCVDGGLVPGPSTPRGLPLFYCWNTDTNTLVKQQQQPQTPSGLMPPLLKIDPGRSERGPGIQEEQRWNVTPASWVRQEGGKPSWHANRKCLHSPHNRGFLSAASSERASTRHLLPSDPCAAAPVARLQEVEPMRKENNAAVLGRLARTRPG